MWAVAEPLAEIITGYLRVRGIPSSLQQEQSPVTSEEGGFPMKKRDEMRFWQNIAVRPQEQKK
jgi:hypothetical protein